MHNESISLYFSEGSSDKEYHAELLAKDDGYLVNFRYGRRGTALTTGTKTATPLPYAKAKAAYDKLVREKVSKGYSPGQTGAAYQATQLEARFTGVVPQLLNAIDEAELERLLDDPLYGLQEKLDGKRILVRCQKDSIEGINRRGLIVALPADVVMAAELLPWGTLLDGELIGEVFHAFDMIEFDGEDRRSWGYDARRRAIDMTFTKAGL